MTAFLYLRYMKSILIAWFLLSQTLSVKDFSATGNGVTDDTNAIQSCLTAAASQGKSVYFPPGVYLCNNTGSDKNVLEFNAGGLSNITIYGTGATIKHTISDTNTLLYVYAFSKASFINISGLKFVNTHGITSAPSYGIFLQGTNGQNLDTVSILSDTLIGFHIALQAQGVNGFNVKNSAFYSPNGHDNGIHGSAVPCVSMWLFDNSNGKVFNADIENNTGNGYTGTLPMACPRPLDGFLYGVVYGATVAGNNLSNYAQEYIDLQPYGTVTQTQSPYFATVYGNNFNCTLPVGSVEDDGVTLHKYNYAIRVDCPNVTVISNSFNNYVWGVLSRPFDFSTDSVYNLNVTNNTFITPADTTTNIVQHDLYFVGNSYASPNIRMYSNLTLRSDTSRLFITGASNPYTYGNQFRPTNQ